MAKKLNVNILEAHFEKAILFLAVAALGWVIFTCFINTPGVEVNDEIIPPVDLASDAAEIATNAKKSMKKIDRDSKNILPYKLVADKKLFNVKTIKDSSVHIGPISHGKTDFIVKRIYTIPDIQGDYELNSVTAELTHTLGVIPNPDSETGTNTNTNRFDGGTNNQDGEIDDIDFVTVSGIFPMKQLYAEFKENFDNVKKPLRLYEPIVARVGLQRQLAGDTSSQWQDVARLKVDPLAKNIPSLQDIKNKTQAIYEDMVQRKSSSQEQLLVLKPQPYMLVDKITYANKPWQDPQEKIKLDGKGTAKKGKADRPRAGGAPGLGMLGRPGGGNYGKTRNNNTVLNVDKLYFWAHDGQVTPGKTYRYRIRLGFYNPIAGKKWTTETQKDLETQRILWTKWVQSKKEVKIPARTLFVPKLASSKKQNVANVDVYRYQKAKWYKKTFSVTVGEEIGEIKTQYVTAPDSSKQAVEKSIEIDYRTGATLKAVFPKAPHVSRKGSQVESASISYQYPNMQLQKIAIRSGCWDIELYNTIRAIKKAIKSQRDQKNKPKTNRGGMTPR